MSKKRYSYGTNTYGLVWLSCCKAITTMVVFIDAEDGLAIIKCCKGHGYDDVRVHI